MGYFSDLDLELQQAVDQARTAANKLQRSLDKIDRILSGQHPTKPPAGSAREHRENRRKLQAALGDAVAEQLPLSARERALADMRRTLAEATAEYVVQATYEKGGKR